MLLLPVSLCAETLRLATWAAPLSRDGPGLLLRDILRGEDPGIAAITAVLVEVRPDILVLTDFDYDAGGAALAVFAQALATNGLTYVHTFARAPNSGMATGLDLDGDGRTGTPRDAQGYGRFAGDGGIAILSTLPILEAGGEDHSATLWADLPWATLPAAGIAAEAQAIQRLSSTAHWVVPVDFGGVPLRLLVWSATPPVFDGPEDRNGLRNRDELLFWKHWLDSQDQATLGPFALMGNANLDPSDGEGYRDAMAEVLGDPRLTDPRPASVGGALAADPDQTGGPALDTADWPDGAPGNLRVSYVLPSADLTVVGSGVVWPGPDDPLSDLLGEDGLAAGPHRLVWVDVRLGQE